MIVIPNSTARLLKDVPFHLNYEHVRKFDNANDQLDYFLSKPAQVVSDLTYQRDDTFIKVPIAYDKLYDYNYLMYQNKEFGGKWFYAFIIKKEYVNPETTRIYFRMDVFQSYQFDMTWKPSYVVREHRTRWNADGSPVVNTLDEGLHYGEEYETVSMQHYLPYGDIFFLVMIAKRRMDNDEVQGGNYFPAINGVPQPLVYYIHPFKLDGSVPNVMVDGEGAGLSPVLEVIRAVAKSEDMVNNIVNMYITDYTGIPMTYDGAFNEWNMSRENVTVNYVDNGEGGTVTTLHAFHIPTYEEKKATFPNVYDDFHDVTESKLYMYPYTVTILSDMKGNMLELKNEYLEGNDLEISVQGSLGTSNKVSYTVTNYLQGAAVPEELARILGLETSIINNNPNDLPILSDYLAAFLQGNRNTMQTNLNSAFFSGLTNFAGNVAGGVRNAGGIIGAGGNAYFGIESINSKIKDIRNTPPTLSSLGANTYFDYGNGVTGLYIIKKQIRAEYRKKLTDFFHMFGYMVNELKIPNLKTRNAFNFVKTMSAHIVGPIPQEALSELKNMFNNGITLWHGDYVGDYSMDNSEL
jgi:hypothetical protein